MESLVSVIVLTYNQEKYIAQTLDSIIDQERAFPIEVLVNDDCSTDSTAEIVRVYQQKYPDIIKAHIQPENSGAMKSYYNMLRLCSGKYLMNVAGDDYWLPGKMKLQFEYMENHPDIGMCFGRCKVMRDNRFIANCGTKEGESFEALLSGNYVSPLTVCVRKSVLDTYIATVHPEQRNWQMEDWPMALWFSKYSKIHFIDKDLGVYRILGGSISHPRKLKEKLAFSDACKEICLYFAGDNKEYIKQVEMVQERTKANIYLAFNDLEKFRIHNSNGGMRGLAKNVVSYLPGGTSFLKWIIFNKYYFV